MKVTFKSYRKEVESALYDQIKKGLDAIGVTAENYAKENCPVDTGRLRNSIAHKVSDDDVYIGSNVEYAPAVEFREAHHTTGQAHFLRDAATTHGSEYKTIMEAALKK